MKNTRILIFVTVLIASLSFSNLSFASTKADNETQTLTISAAASLKNVLTEVQRNFERQNKNIKLVFNFGGSGTLEKQIEAGAPVDIFISADTKNIEKLKDKNLIDNKSTYDVATNQLVLVTYINNSFKVRNINDLTKNEVDHICLGALGSVPAGDYAKQSLTYYKLWDKVSNKIVYAKDVTSVLTYVKSGNAMAGFVYLTDAKQKSDAIIKQVLPNQSHDLIVYKGAIISSTQYKEASMKFMDYLKGTKAHIIFSKYGFGSSLK